MPLRVPRHLPIERRPGVGRGFAKRRERGGNNDFAHARSSEAFGNPYHYNEDAFRVTCSSEMGLLKALCTTNLDHHVTPASIKLTMLLFI